MSGAPFWYKDAIIYQFHVKAFCDSSGDGIGDFPGLTSKLGYLQDLGVTALWLLPFYPSPQRDDGYDISNYKEVHPNYGVLRDFKTFLKEAHERGMRVITELVLNHTSDQHPWFQRARRARPGSPERDFYVWSDSPDRYADARIIFKDFETSNWTWDPVAGAYYWHRFYSHQPDLNFENPVVGKTMCEIVDYWLDLGVDGLRLDAVPYLFEREDTTCENLPETHEWLKELRRHVDLKFKNRMLLAEANQWPEDAVAYLGEADECHMALHFPLMPRIFMSVGMEDRFPIIDILKQTPPIDESCQWAIFLRNHDELTLEMVTEEERAYMYRAYAAEPRARINLGIRRRLAPLLGNNRRKIELMNGLLLTLAGTPIIYYGDEIGMGDNIYLGDRDGVRTPLQWSGDRNAGFSQANPQRLYLPVIIDPEYHYETVNVETQESNQHSLLWWTKRMISLRKRYKAFGRGSLEFLSPSNHKVLAFIRRYEDECILIVANLSRFVQYVELDLSAFEGLAPVELFGQTVFPRIGELPYLLTLGPHAFNWFSLRADHSENGGIPADSEIPTLQGKERWRDLLDGHPPAEVESALQRYLQPRRWFAQKARKIHSVKVEESFVLGSKQASAVIVLLSVEYLDIDPETYILPLTYATAEKKQTVLANHPDAIVAHVRLEDGSEGVLYDALLEPDFHAALLDVVARRRRFKGTSGEFVASQTSELRRIVNESGIPLSSRVLSVEQSNTSIAYNDTLILKVFRRLEAGIHPDLEVGKYLTARNFDHTPPVAGALEYRRPGSEPITLGLFQRHVTNVGDAWTHTLGSLNDFFERAEGRPHEDATLPTGGLLASVGTDPSPLAHELIADYLDRIKLLGRRTGELHVALGTGSSDPAFVPEPFTPFAQRSLYQSVRNLSGQSLDFLRRNLSNVPDGLREECERLVGLEATILRRLHIVLDGRLTGKRIRCHGDYHLGQVLWTGRDFVIIDFEGEPSRTLVERRFKRSAVRDVAGMLRSFQYAAQTSLDAKGKERAGSLDIWARYWRHWVSTAFLQAYLAAADGAGFLPQEEPELRMLLEIHLLEKAMYELTYELNHRPDWLHVPVRALLEMVGGEDF